MRNNILNNSFITFALIALILVGCNPNGTLAKIKSHTNSKANANQSNDIQTKSNSDEEHAQDNLKEDNEKTALIAEIIKKAQTSIALINGYKNNIEDNDQYGMEWGVFRFLNNEKNKKTLNSPENIHIRKQFYLSLEWKKDTLKKFGTIIKDNTDNLAKTILFTGIHYAHEYFEWIINIIHDKKHNLRILTLQELKDIKNKLVKIDGLRKKWRDTIDNIIAEYEADNDMQNNNQKLIQHVNSKYGTIFNTEIPSIQVLSQDIAKILK
ncbi:complement regulator-acquiring protein (plasmid) [Borrelia parkeri]|uniref:complement regulator-acquiring protein n=1 Tax=Borrelia parkeri TaxID=141 RepID=UPI001FF67DEA|nr:complement regulator-acquiring protein [Borrelia parkeri]UPA11218.1 complement regulator-acquiring protein [Borrelia parkeri]